MGGSSVETTGWNGNEINDLGPCHGRLVAPVPAGHGVGWNREGSQWTQQWND